MSDRPYTIKDAKDILRISPTEFEARLRHAADPSRLALVGAQGAARWQAATPKERDQINFQAKHADKVGLPRGAKVDAD
jgi:hypothetical protein